MELHGKKTFWSFLEEEQKPGHHSPNRTDPPRFSASRLSSATAVSSISPCGSPWTLSPLHHLSPSPSPSPSILYHCLASLQRQDGNVLSIAISKGLVFTGSESDRVRIWKQPDCVDRGLIRTNHAKIRAMLAHGDTLFTSHKDNRVRAWTVTTASDRIRSRKLATLPARTAFLIQRFTKHSHHQHKDTISCLALHPADALLYTGSFDRTVKAWSLTEKACVDSFVAHEGHVSAMLVSPDDGCLFTASADGSVKIWRRVYGDNSHALTMALRFQSSPVNALAMAGGGGADRACFLYSGSSDGYVNIWGREAVSGRFHHGGFLQGHRYAVLSLAAVGMLVLSGSEDTTIRVWRREKGSGGLHTCLAVMEGHRGPVRCLAVVEEGEEVSRGLLLYSASLDRMVKVWRIKVVLGKEGEEDQGEERRGLMMEYEMSPVLSPLWVEKRIHGSHLL